MIKEGYFKYVFVHINLYKFVETVKLMAIALIKLNPGKCSVRVYYKNFIENIPEGKRESVLESMASALNEEQVVLNPVKTTPKVLRSQPVNDFREIEGLSFSSIENIGQYGGVSFVFGTAKLNEGRGLFCSRISWR